MQARLIPSKGIPKHKNYSTISNIRHVGAPKTTLIRNNNYNNNNSKRKFCSTAKKELEESSPEQLKSQTDFRKQVNKNNNIAVAISGGVDSLVTAQLLKLEKYSLLGFHMTNWDNSNDESMGVNTIKGRCSEQDAKDAERLCQLLNIPLHHANFVKEYWNEVWMNTLQDYERGLTPNPDILCNQYIKANHFVDYVAKEQFSCSIVATGHYARKRLIFRRKIQNEDSNKNSRDNVKVSQKKNDIDKEDKEDKEDEEDEYDLVESKKEVKPIVPQVRYEENYTIIEDVNNIDRTYFDSGKFEWQLIRAEDKKKDQTYFLSTLSQVQLHKLIFPIGNMLKSEVKKIGNISGFDFITSKKESTGVCFIGKRKNFYSFLSQYINISPGPIKFLGDSACVGSHNGLSQYTVGQRVSLYHSTSKPIYCVHKDVNSNCLYVVEGFDHPAQYSKGLYCFNFSWISGSPPSSLLKGESLRCEVKVRYSQTTYPCKVTLAKHKQLATHPNPTLQCIHKKDVPKIVKILFDEPVHSVTPGQYAVLYLGEICLGGGKILCPENESINKFYPAHISGRTFNRGFKYLNYNINKQKMKSHRKAVEARRKQIEERMRMVRMRRENRYKISRNNNVFHDSSISQSSPSSPSSPSPSSLSSPSPNTSDYQTNNSNTTRFKNQRAYKRRNRERDVNYRKF